MNIITGQHDFNLPIKFTADGYFAFVTEKRLLLARQIQSDYKAHYVDGVENTYTFDLFPKNAQNDKTFAVLNPKESRVIARTEQF